MDRVLILSADFGAGHLQAARAIASACVQSRPTTAVHVVNIATPLLSLISSGYLTLLQTAPAAYRQLYHAPGGSAASTLIRAALLRAVRHEVTRFRPTAIIATHPFPGAAAAYLRRRGELQATVSMAVTDFIPHPLWVQRGVDRYFVASPEAAAHLGARGVAPDRITVSGIPIRLEFAGAPVRQADNTRHVLVMGGGLGLGPIVDAVASITDLPHGQLRVTVVCGKNQDLLRQLHGRFGADPRLEILGYTDRIPGLMASSDLLVTKPGGITCSEALAVGLPMLLLRPLPGQEEENASHLVATGAAAVTAEERIGDAAASLLFGAPERLHSVRQCALAAGQPHAAGLIAAQTLSSLQVEALA